MAPHESPRRRELTALKERRKAHLENDRLRKLQDGRDSLDNTEKTSEGSTTSTPVPPLQDAPGGSPKRHVPASELADLRKRMVVYREEERRLELQEEELQDTLANTECNAEMAGEGSTQTAQDSTDAGAPPGPVTTTVPPPQGSDNGQESGLSNDNLTELEVMLANPNLPPEDRAFTESTKFKNVRKMVPGNVTTAR